jgi:hypothetical protein
MAADHSELLLFAARHVAEGRRIVARQRERIARLKAAGASTLDAEQTLKVFETSLVLFEEHETHLRPDKGRGFF